MSYPCPYAGFIWRNGFPYRPPMAMVTHWTREPKFGKVVILGQ
ncbi:MAG TPA: hypothetical protein VIY48_10430 [Candidatus Paceibacterota bacterium]